LVYGKTLSRNFIGDQEIQAREGENFKKDKSAPVDTMKAHGVGELKVRALLTSALAASEWSPSHFSHSTCGERTHTIH
jgi:hypothetical protein